MARSLRRIERVHRLQRIRRSLEQSQSTRPRLIRVASVQDFVPLVSPHYQRPSHLGPMTRELDRILRGEPIEICVAAPPRHLKTSTVRHFVAHLHTHRPELKVLYACASSRLASDNVRAIMALEANAGVELGAVRRQTYFETAAGGSVLAVGMKTQIIGRGFDVVVVDDPHASRKEAESRAMRENVVAGFLSDIYTRQEPGRPTSFIVLHTRWHEADLIGCLIKPREDVPPFQYINLPAINHHGEALAPSLFPAHRLRLLEARLGPYEWASQFQGAPRPRGGALFGDAVLCDAGEVPRSGRYAIGVDLAHTKKTRSDYNAAVVMVRGPDSDVVDPKTGARLRRFYVVDVRHEQGRLTTERRKATAERPESVTPGFVQTLRAVQRAYPGARTEQYIGGKEDLVLDLLSQLQEERVHITGRPAATDKWVRAQPLAAAWGNGEILIPIDAEWADGFISELAGFTGLEGGRDDQVDAAAAAFDALNEGDGLTVLTPNSGPSTYRDAPTTTRTARRGFFAG